MLSKEAWPWKKSYALSASEMASSPSRSLHQETPSTPHVVGRDGTGNRIRVGFRIVSRLQLPRVLPFSEPNVLEGQFLVSKVVVSMGELEHAPQRIQKRLPPEEHRIVLQKDARDRFHIIQKLLLDLRCSFNQPTHF